MSEFHLLGVVLAAAAIAWLAFSWTVPPHLDD